MPEGEIVIRNKGSEISFLKLRLLSSTALDKFDNSHNPHHIRDWFKKLLYAISQFEQENKILIESISSNEESSYLSTHLIFLSIDVRNRYGTLLIDAIDDMIKVAFDLWIKTKKADVVNMSLFKRIGWVNIFQQRLLLFCQACINTRVEDECSESVLEPKLKELKTWLMESVIPFTVALLHGTESNVSSILEHCLYCSYSSNGARSLFDMVTEFPESLPALRQLKEAIGLSSSLRNVGKTFQSILKKRLLHPGASTSQVLEVYISAIRALRVIDPSDLLLKYVAAPVRSYLLGRKDTVRCIVSSLTEGHDLHGELRKGGSLECAADEDDEEGGPGVNWEPARRDVELQLESGDRGQDVLALLVSIYGSTTVFVSEYRSLLADKLLNNLDYNSDAEIANLELLKRRFGDESLHSCEVMLRDLEQSKRVNTAVLSEIKKENSSAPTLSAETEEACPAADCLLISDNYWPALRNSEPMTLHPTAASLIAGYQKVYSVIKYPRKARPLAQLGKVDLELSFKDGTVRQFTVLPAQASLILCFGEEEPGVAVSSTGSVSVALADLATKSELSESVVRQLMSLWVGKGVVCERSADGAVVYETIEAQRGRLGDDDVDDDQALQQLSDGMSEALASDSSDKVLETYVRGMLSSQESMTLERIHSMLKMMASISSSSGGPSDWQFQKSIVQFRHYLQGLVEVDVLEVVGEGLYRLRR